MIPGALMEEEALNGYVNLIDLTETLRVFDTLNRDDDTVSEWRRGVVNDCISWRWLRSYLHLESLSFSRAVGTL